MFIQNQHASWLRLWRLLKAAMWTATRQSTEHIYLYHWWLCVCQLVMLLSPPTSQWTLLCTVLDMFWSTTELLNLLYTVNSDWLWYTFVSVQLELKMMHIISLFLMGWVKKQTSSNTSKTFGNISEWDASEGSHPCCRSCCSYRLVYPHCLQKGLVMNHLINTATPWGCHGELQIN